MLRNILQLKIVYIFYAEILNCTKTSRNNFPGLAIAINLLKNILCYILFGQ